MADTLHKAQAYGIATLNALGKVPADQIDLAASDNVASVISRTGAIDGTALGATTLFTVPAAKKTVVLRVVIRLTAIVGGTGMAKCPKVSIGTNGAVYDDIFSDTRLTGLDATTKIFVFHAEFTLHESDAAEVIKLIVNTASNATTYTIEVDLIGYNH